MGVSYDVIGIKPVDEFSEKMRTIYENCKELGVKVPNDVIRYFNQCGDLPTDEGFKVDIPSEYWVGEYEEGYQINVEDIPEGVKIIKFRMSY